MDRNRSASLCISNIYRAHALHATGGGIFFILLFLIVSWREKYASCTWTTIYSLLFVLFICEKEYVCTCYSAVAEYKVNRNNKRGCWNREHTKGQLLICHRSKGLTWMTPSCVSLKLGRTIYYICWFRHMVSQEKIYLQIELTTSSSQPKSPLLYIHMTALSHEYIFNYFAFLIGLEKVYLS